MYCMCSIVLLVDSFEIKTICFIIILNVKSPVIFSWKRSFESISQMQILWKIQLTHKESQATSVSFPSVKRKNVKEFFTRIREKFNCLEV